MVHTDLQLPMHPAALPLIEVERCTLCGGKERVEILRGPDRMQGVPGTFVVVQCVQCGLAYQSPRPADEAIDALYPAEYEPFQIRVGEQGYIPRDFRRTAAFVAAQKKAGGRLLDVGCSNGDFLLTMTRLFPEWNGAGVEPSPVAAARAQQRGLQVQCGTLVQVDPSAPPFDIITLWNVLEHVPDPVTFLHEIRHRLARDGCLCLAVPVKDSWEARIFGKYWVGWELPRHFTLFDRITIAATLQAAGFEIVQQACVSGTYYAVIRSALLALEGAAWPAVLRRCVQAVLNSPLMRILVKPYTWLAERRKRGTILTIAARRKDWIAP